MSKNIVVYLEQDSPEWHEFRKDHIGASEIAAILGLNPWMSRKKLLNIKSGLRDPDPCNVFMQRGKDREPFIREKADQELGDYFLPRVHLYDLDSVISASLDGLNFAEDRLLEIKSCSVKVFDQCVEGIIPDYYQAQVQQQLLCTPTAGEAVFFCELNTDFKKTAYLTVKPDSKFQDRILNEVDSFWQEVIKLRGTQ